MKILKRKLLLLKRRSFLETFIKKTNMYCKHDMLFFSNKTVLFCKKSIANKTHDFYGRKSLTKAFVQKL